MKKIIFCLMILCGLAGLLILKSEFSKEKIATQKRVVNLYSAQQEHLIRPVLEEFTKQTGIEVQLITGDATGLVTRIQQEGKNTQADVLLTADIGNLYQAKVRGLLQPIKSDLLEQNIPQNLRDSEGEWYGFTVRSRLLFVRKNDMNDALKNINYTDLANEQWHGGILVRSSEHVYNQSLLSSIIFNDGEVAAEKFTKGLVENLARAPQGGDRDQLRALAAGEGKIAIANSYYYAMLISEDPALKDDLVKQNVVPLIPNQTTTGAHINIRGGAVIKYAHHKAEATELLEFLSEKNAQKLFAQLNREYPVNPKVKSSPEMKVFGEVKFDSAPLEKIGALQAQSIKIMDKNGWR